MPNHVRNILTITGDKKQVRKFVDLITTKEKDTGSTYLSFNTLIPMPESLNIMSGGISEDCFRIYFKNLYKTNREEYLRLKKIFEVYNTDQVWNFKQMNLEELSDEKESEKTDYIFKNYSKKKEGYFSNDPILATKEDIIKYGSKMAKNVELYGCKDWYDWCKTNWSTKWDAYDQSYMYEDQENSKKATCIIKFNTAWSIPENFYEKMFDIIHKENYNVNVKIDFADEDEGGTMGTIVDINIETGSFIGYIYEEDEDGRENFYEEVWGE